MYEMEHLLIVLWVIIVSSSANDEYVVQTEDGKIQGTSTTNLDGEVIYSFLGIPYAKPPTGDLRFKDPVPVEPWNRTFDATELGDCCFQEGFIGSEDCLNLNVHTKKGIADGIVGPVIENPNDSQFLTKSALEILKSGKYNKVPIMMGYCSNEGLLLEVEKRRMIANHTALFKGPESHMEVKIPLNINLQMNQTWGSHIDEELIDIYFKGKNADNKYLLASDYFFISGIIGSAELHVNTSTYPVYLYRMTLDAGRNLLKRLLHLDNFPGVCHADDLGYLFNISGLEMGEKEEQYVRTFVKLWTNFAKYGNPTPNGTDLEIEWKPLHENQSFIDIGEKLTLQNKPEVDRMSVWQEIYPDLQARDTACAISILLSSLIPTLLCFLLCMDI